MLKLTAKYIQKLDVDSLSREALDADLADVASMVETAIAERTPVITGRLKGSFVARKLAPLDYEVATNVEYAPYVEYGTSRFAPRAMMRKGAAEVKEQGVGLLRRTANLKK